MILKVDSLKNSLNYYVEAKLGDFSGKKDYAEEAMYIYMQVDHQRRKIKSVCSAVHIELKEKEIDDLINIFSDMFDLCLEEIKKNKGAIEDLGIFRMLDSANFHLRKFTEYKKENMTIDEDK